MTDEEFLKAFEDCTLKGFHHIDHIRMAWLYLRKYGFEEATACIVKGIRHFALSHHQNQLYHETITVFWIRVVDHVRREYPKEADFESLLLRAPFLAESKSIYKHYDPEFLMSDRPRREWCPPDFLPMPDTRLP